MQRVSPVSVATCLGLTGGPSREVVHLSFIEVDIKNKRQVLLSETNITIIISFKGLFLFRQRQTQESTKDYVIRCSGVN